MTKKTIIPIGPSGPVKFPIDSSFLGENRSLLADPPDNPSVFPRNNSVSEIHKMKNRLGVHQGDNVSVFQKVCAATLFSPFFFGLARAFKKTTGTLSRAVFLRDPLSSFICDVLASPGYDTKGLKKMRHRG